MANVLTEPQPPSFYPMVVPRASRWSSKSHWTGSTGASPRSRHPCGLARPELRQPGVYVLMGPADEASYEAAPSVLGGPLIWGYRRRLATETGAAA